jgi:hypothetical protein
MQALGSFHLSLGYSRKVELANNVELTVVEERAALEYRSIGIRL